MCPVIKKIKMNDNDESNNQNEANLRIAFKTFWSQMTKKINAKIRNSG